MAVAVRTNTTVTVVHPTGTATDPYGGNRPDWTTATRSSRPAWLEQTTGAEHSGDDRQAAVSEWLLMLYADAAIEHGDRVEHNSRTFEVVAPPDVKWALGGPHHTEARLRLVQP